MGVTLHYRTVQPVPERVRQQILKETKCLEQERSWWTEPIHFSDAASQQQMLDGSSKVPPNDYETLDGRQVTIESNDWAFMAYWDFQFIISTLCRWSVQYALEWELFCEGNAGGISKGELDFAANKFLKEIAKGAKASADERVNEQHNREISKRYASWLELFTKEASNNSIKG